MVGNYADPSKCEFEGKIDEIKLYDVACTESELLAEYTRMLWNQPVCVWCDCSGAANWLASLSWTPVFLPSGDEPTYLVVSGDLGTLRSTGGDFSQSVTACLANGTTETSVDLVGDPAPGEGVWYLVRPVGPDGPYSYNTDDPYLAAPRDHQIEASSNACLPAPGDDTCDQAVPVNLPHSEVMSIAFPGDHNWRRFNLSEATFVSIETLSGDPTDDTDLTLYGGCIAGTPDTLIAFDDDGGQGTLSLIEGCLSPGDYWLQVGGFFDIATPDDFTLELSSAGGCVP